MHIPYFPSSFSIPEPTYTLLTDLIRRRLGLDYDENKRDMLADKLSPLLSERSMTDFQEYYYLLKYDPEADREWERVQSALAVNETYFWRESDHFTLVASELAPRQLQTRERSFRIWHAGCCTGEEPYSMAMALNDHLPALASSIQIVATDANRISLAVAQRGIFGSRSFRQLPARMHEQYFTAHQGRWQLLPEIRERVDFRYMNLVDPIGMAGMRRFDAIFCRNVFIYFSPAAIERVSRYFYEALVPGGYLLLGASESLLRYNTPLEFTEMGGTIGYQRPLQ